MIPPILLGNIATFIKAYAHSDLFGKVVILGLVFLSLVCWLVLIQKLWMTKRVMKVSAEFKQAYLSQKDKLLSLNIDQMPKSSHPAVPNPFAQIFSELKGKTVDILNKNIFFSKEKNGSDSGKIYLLTSDLDSIESHTLSTVADEAKKLEKNLFVLATIITLAPFLGLLGTVWGILVSFGELGGGASAASNMAILGGLSTALATTVLGLIIAIPALISYNYLKNTLRHYTSDMEGFLYDLLSTVEIQYRKVEHD